jgi:hypothetical protein
MMTPKDSLIEPQSLLPEKWPNFSIFMALKKIISALVAPKGAKLITWLQAKAHDCYPGLTAVGSGGRL